MKSAGALVLVAILTFLGNYIILGSVGEEIEDHVLHLNDSSQIQIADSFSRKLSYNIKTHIKHNYEIFIPLFILLFIASVGGYAAGHNEQRSREQNKGNTSATSSSANMTEQAVNVLVKQKLNQTSVFIKKYNTMYNTNLVLSIILVVAGIVTIALINQKINNYKALMAVGLIVSGLMFSLGCIYAGRKIAYVEAVHKVAELLRLNENITERLLAYIAQTKYRMLPETLWPDTHENVNYREIAEKIGDKRINEIWNQLYLDKIYK